tara:strand:+ start:7171 stop:9444 length:2274 start_codon:yes stop_codon:yes gene_type:complete
MIYILTSTKTILKADVRPQESKLGDSVAKGVLNLKLKQQLTSESFSEQGRYLEVAAIAAYVSLNGLDQRHRYRASINLVSMQSEAFNFTQGSSSSGLGYALAVFDSWWRLVLKKSGGFEHPIFATGQVLTSGQVRPISHLSDKIQSTCEFVSTHKPEISQFYLCYPEQNTNDISDAQRRKVTKLGGILVPVTRLQSVLGTLLGDDYDGDPLGRWEPFKGLKSFNYEDSVRFFGRESDVELLYQDLKSTRSVLIFTGASASGKTSIINAGLIPRLERDNPEYYCSSQTYLETLKSDGVLYYVLEQLSIAWDLKSKSITVDDLHRRLEESTTEGVDFLSNIVKDDSKACFIVIDQLEEMLTPPGKLNEKIVAEFKTIQAIVEAFNSLDILVAIKIERLGEFLGCKALHEPKISSLASRLSAENWKAIIQQQAIFSGLSYEIKESGESLDDLILSEVIRTEDSLPMLSFLLEQLYQKAIQRGSNTSLLIFSDYEQLGGLVGAVAYRANEILISEGADEGLAAEFYELFVGYMQESGSFVKSVPITIIELMRPPLRKVIQKFIDADLLIYVDNYEQLPAMTLVSDRLLDEWPELKKWIEKSSDYLIWRNKIEKDFYRWLLVIDNKEDICIDPGIENNHYYWMYLYLKLWVKIDHKNLQERWQEYIDNKINSIKNSPINVIDKSSYKAVIANEIRKKIKGKLYRYMCAKEFLLNDISLLHERGGRENLNPLLDRYLRVSLNELYLKPAGVVIITMLLVFLWS